MNHFQLLIVVKKNYFSKSQVIITLITTMTALTLQELWGHTDFAVPVI